MTKVVHGLMICVAQEDNESGVTIITVMIATTTTKVEYHYTNQPKVRVAQIMMMTMITMMLTVIAAVVLAYGSNTLLLSSVGVNFDDCLFCKDLRLFFGFSCCMVEIVFATIR